MEQKDTGIQQRYNDSLKSKLIRKRLEGNCVFQ